MTTEQPTSTKEFAGALRKLGWLSSYSRQVLIARHLLRNLATISYPEDIPGDIPNDFPLDLFRCSITILTGVNREVRKFSSPYDFRKQPDTHHLAYNRKARIFSVSIASGMPEVHFHTGLNDGFGFENSTEVSLEDGLLSFEIRAVSRNVSLFKKALGDQRAEALRNEKLWRGLASEEQATATNFFDNWHQWSGKNGAFWREWYQGFLDGKPLDWELQRRVALIDDPIWEAGPKAVAEEIEKIRVIFELEKRISDLEADLRSASVNRHGIGGNLPPELPDEVPVAQELVFIWQPLNDLKKEIANQDPKPSHLQSIIETLDTALKTGFAWCLKKGDLIVDTAIKWAIPAIGTGYLTLNPEKLEAVIKTGMSLLGLL